MKNDDKELNENEIEIEEAVTDNQLNYLSSLGKRKGARVLAWICIAIIVALIVATFITGITGSKYFAGCLFLCIIVPLLLYVFLWIGKLLFSSHK